MDRHILVTGAAGFIGSHLCEELIAQGYLVTGIDNFDSFYPRVMKESNLSRLQRQSAFKFLEGDAGNANLLDKIDSIPDAVIHLAAKAGVQPSLKKPADYILQNILLSNNLLEWMKEKNIRKFVFASSSSVYGNASTMPFRESQEVNEPVSPYAFSKRSCELMNYTYHSLYKFDIINLRFFTVYGERQRPDLAIHKFVAKISKGEPIQLYGNGETARDYTYWRDTVSGVTAALAYVLNHEDVFETVNLGNHSPITLSELVNTIAVVMKKQPIIRYEEKKPGDVDITYADITKAGELLGYQPKTTLGQGIDAFVKWYNDTN